MAYKRRDQKKNIYCLEGVWWPNQKRHDSVGPMLEVLGQCPSNRCTFTHWRVPEVSMLEWGLRDWAKRKYDSFPILMLAFHCWEGTLFVGSGKNGQGSVDLDWIAEQLEGRCDNRIVHISGCASMNVKRSHVNSFLRRTGALALSGYRHEIDWLVPLAFELVYFADLQRHDFTRSGVQAALREVERETGTLKKKLGFQIALREAR
jgi:hypothetical protein